MDIDKDKGYYYTEIGKFFIEVSFECYLTAPPESKIMEWDEEKDEYRYWIISGTKASLHF